MKNKKIFPRWIIPLVVLAVVVGALFYFRAHPVQVKAPAVDLTTVHTTKVVSGSIETGISTTGTVRTNQTTSLAWNTSGQVAQVAVKIGDQVKAGQILAQLDPGSNTLFATTQASLLTAQEALASLQNTASAVATAKIAVLQAQAAVDSAQKALAALQVVPTQAQIDAAYAAYLQDQKSVNRLQVAFNILASNPVTDLDRANALQALNTAVQKENQDQGTYNQLNNHQPDTAALSTAQINLGLAQQQLALAQANDTLASAGPNAAQIGADQANIQQYQATLNDQFILATSAGTVTSVSVQVGDLVSAGTAAFQIDDMSSLYVDLSVSETEINNVQIGQPVELTYDAIPNQDYTAKVTNISSVGAVSGGVASYTVTALLTNADSLVRPGMTTTAVIVTKQLSNVLLVPNLSVASLKGHKMVYVMAGGQVNPVGVTVNLTSDTQSAVTAPALKAGDVIITNPASLVATASTGKFETLLSNLGVIVIS